MGTYLRTLGAVTPLADDAPDPVGYAIRGLGALSPQADAPVAEGIAIRGLGILGPVLVDPAVVGDLFYWNSVTEETSAVQVWHKSAGGTLTRLA